MSDSRVFVDTNVLVAATDADRAHHVAATELLGSGRNLTTSGQVLREYLVVATRPVSVNGLGLRIPHALENLHELRSRIGVLTEDRRVLERLRALLLDVECHGKQIHDANVAATMLVHGVRRLVTANGAHFHRFAAWLDIAELQPAEVR